MRIFDHFKVNIYNLVQLGHLRHPFSPKSDSNVPMTIMSSDIADRDAALSSGMSER